MQSPLPRGWPVAQIAAAGQALTNTHREAAHLYRLRANGLPPSVQHFKTCGCEQGEELIFGVLGFVKRVRGSIGFVVPL